MNRQIPRRRRFLSEALAEEKVGSQTTIKRLLFYETGAMSFLENNIPPNLLKEILLAASSSAWLGKWKLVSVTDKSIRTRVVEAWQNSLRKMGLDKDVAFVERWKIAPLFVVFCQPVLLEPHRFVPAEQVKTFSIQEVGGAVRSLELAALTHGVGLHGIMGILVPEIGNPIEKILNVPADYEIVYFGVMGYPNEEAPQKFPGLEEYCYAERWGEPIRTTPR